jgi:hypothetical protein
MHGGGDVRTDSGCWSAKASMILDVYADLFDEGLDGIADRFDAAIGQLLLAISSGERWWRSRHSAPSPGSGDGARGRLKREPGC